MLFITRTVKILIFIFLSGEFHLQLTPFPQKGCDYLSAEMGRGGGGGGGGGGKGL